MDLHDDGDEPPFIQQNAYRATPGAPPSYELDQLPDLPYTAEPYVHTTDEKNRLWQDQKTEQ